jgi:hypothetical protein
MHGILLNIYFSVLNPYILMVLETEQWSFHLKKVTRIEVKQVVRWVNGTVNN